MYTYNEDAYAPEGAALSSLRNREYTASLAGLERAMATGAILEGTVTLCDAGLNLHVDFPGLPDVHGLMERAEVVYTHDGEAVKDIAILTRVGKAICFKVIGIDIQPGGTTVYLSRRAAQAECLHSFVEGLLPGDILRARVTHLENFGAFVDIGCGLPSLLSVDTISVSRIAHPRDRLYGGQFIWVVVRHVDHAHHRVFVSMRELLGTWEENAARFEPGQTVAGIVRSVEDYGVFVELAPNLAGLAEFREEHRAALGGMVGRCAAVFIKSILPERMKIKLVLIDTYKTDTLPAPRLTYYITGEETDHLSRWLYSPPTSTKRIETVFE